MVLACVRPIGTFYWVLTACISALRSADESHLSMPEIVVFVAGFEVFRFRSQKRRPSWTPTPNSPSSCLPPHCFDLQVQIQEEGFHEDIKEMAGWTGAEIYWERLQEAGSILQGHQSYRTHPGEEFSNHFMALEWRVKCVFSIAVHVRWDSCVNK